MQLFSLEEHSRRLEAALQRLAPFGLRVATSSRFHRYVSILRGAYAAEADGDFAHQSDEKFVNAVIEADDIIAIASLDDRWLSEPLVREKLRQIGKGKEFAGASGFDPARDLQFELSAAATFARRGALGGFLVAGGDFAVAPKMWPAECKRITSLSEMIGRLADGRDQLAGGSPGMLLADLTRPMRADLGPLRAASDAELEAKVHRLLAGYMPLHVDMHQLIERLERPEVLGLAVRYVAYGHVGEGDAQDHVRTSTSWQLYMLHADDSPATAEFDRATAALGQDLDWGNKSDIAAGLRDIMDTRRRRAS